MNTKRNFYMGAVFAMITALFFVSCKKKKAFKEEDAQDAVDVRFVQGACDEAIKDINTVITEQFLLRGRGTGMESVEESTTSVCGISLDTTKITSGVMMLNYTGSGCTGMVRDGSIKFSINGYPLTKWKHVGCTLSIEFLDYKVAKFTGGKNIKLNGKMYLVNESGNTWYELWYLNESSVTNRMYAYDIKVVFDDGDYGVFNFDRRLKFSYQNNVTSCRVEGNAERDNTSNAENWGLSRRGDYFTTQVSSPYVWKTSCGAAVPLSGEVIVKMNDKEHELSCEFGVNSYGDSQNGKDIPCPYGWKTSWSRKNKTNSRVFSYF